MHHTERASSNFRINSSASYLAHLTTTEDEEDDTEEQDKQQHHVFHMRTFGKNAMSYNDDDDDDVKYT